MDKKAAISCLEKFMLTDDERAFNYEQHGKIIVRSQANGPTTVEVQFAPDIGYAPPSFHGSCDTAKELYNAINSGLKKLDMPDDVADDLETFIEFICPEE